jgi:hypothetical protein
VDSQFIVVELGSSSTQLGEVVIRPHEDPIVALLKNVIAKKPVNNPEKFENYRYEAYNKVEIEWSAELARKLDEQLRIAIERAERVVAD